MRDTVSIARVWRFGMNDRLECNSDSRNCPEFTLMIMWCNKGITRRWKAQITK